MKYYLQPCYLQQEVVIAPWLFLSEFNICREDYKHYLGRPDLKQKLVSQWQKDFNSTPDDMREDEDTKAELHQRLDVRKNNNMLYYNIDAETWSW